MKFITVTRIDGSAALFNVAHIVSVVAATRQSPISADAVINTVDGKSQAVLETVEEVGNQIVGLSCT